MSFLGLAAAWSSLTCTKGFAAAELSERYLLPYFQGECEWTRHRKQGIYFLRSPWESSGNGSAAVSYSVTFEPTSGDIKMDISVKSQWCWAMWLWFLLPLTLHSSIVCIFNLFYISGFPFFNWSCLKVVTQPFKRVFSTILRILSVIFLIFHITESILATNYLWLLHKLINSIPLNVTISLAEAALDLFSHLAKGYVLKYFIKISHECI